MITSVNKQRFLRLEGMANNMLTPAETATITRQIMTHQIGTLERRVGCIEPEIFCQVVADFFGGVDEVLGTYGFRLALDPAAFDDLSPDMDRAFLVRKYNA
jgi:hypothetical protein